MTERFKHSEFQQDDGQYQYYGIEDTFTHYVYNVIGEGMYDVSEKQIIKLLNELHDENKELTLECRRMAKFMMSKGYNINNYLDFCKEYTDD